MKNILVLYYSQSGQLKEIAQNIIVPLQTEAEITYHTIEPVKAYPFPWNNEAFFNVFPETFTEKEIELKPIPKTILDKKYDLIIFAYQIWFLSPSLPISSFLKTIEAQHLLKKAPIITVIGCRNMWILAHERVKKAFQKMEANLVGNIVLRDRHNNHISVLTIVHWLFTGKKTRYLGFFPLPGVSDEDIKNATVFGKIIKKHTEKNEFDSLQNKLLEQKAVEINPFLLTVEKKATRIFGIWSNIILKNPNKRAFLLRFFNFYLWFAIWVVSPLVFLIYLLLYFFKINSLKKEIKYYQSV